MIHRKRKEKRKKDSVAHKSKLHNYVTSFIPQLESNFVSCNGSNLQFESVDENMTLEMLAGKQSFPVKHFVFSL